MAIERSYGWVPSRPDQNDFDAADILLADADAPKLPRSFRIPRDQFPPIFNQGDIGSCTGNAFVRAYYQSARRRGSYLTDNNGSRLFAYYNGRIPIGMTGVDSGAMNRDVAKGVAKYGVPDEKVWPYRHDLVTRTPSQEAYRNGQRHQVVSYAGVAQRADTIKRLLVRSYPIVVGFTVYPSFESVEVARTGLVPMPGPDERAIGGHAVLLEGYDEGHSHLWELANSWGDDWGDDGYFRMPEAYLTSPRLSADFWVVYSSEG